MKCFLAAGALALLANEAVAFPSLGENAFKATPVVKRQASPPQGAGAMPSTPPPFNATAQHVSTTGAHVFVPPGTGDARGECPGLNALANHAYLPHNGYATIQQFVTGTYQGFGMAADLATFLAVYGAIVDGPGTGWSIGGVPHTGILGSHGNYETDSSPLKGDLNQYGSFRLVMAQFMELYNMQTDPTTANYNLEVLRSFRGMRYTESVNDNPYFVYGPFTGIAVSQAAFTFIYRFMANKSSTYPEGVLNKAVLKSFMSIHGPENNLTWIPGYEQIPDNWYKRNDADQYSIQYFATDIGYFGNTQPEIYMPGCNQGEVNTFNAFNISLLTGGAYTAQSIAANPICFAGQYLSAGAVSLLGLNTSQVSALNTALAAAEKSLGGAPCPAFTPNFAAFTACPGYAMYGGPTGPVAPGAKQFP